MSGGWILLFGAVCGFGGGLGVVLLQDVQRRWQMRRLMKRWLAERAKNPGAHAAVWLPPGMWDEQSARHIRKTIDT